MNNNDKHIAQQIANSFNDNDKKVFTDDFDNFKEDIISIIKEEQLTILEPTSFKYPDSIVDFIEKQSPEELERQWVQTSVYNFLNPSDPANLD